MEKLAIHGGTPVKTTPYGTAKRFGKEELTYLEEALNQDTLFYLKHASQREAAHRATAMAAVRLTMRRSILKAAQ